MAKTTKEEQKHWAGNTPHTAKFVFNKSAAKATPECSKTVACFKDLAKYCENYPEEAATLSIIYEPEAIKYFFPLLSISNEELDMIKKIIKSQIYARVLSKCKDINILDRLEAQINPSITINFSVLPSNDGEINGA